MKGTNQDRYAGEASCRLRSSGRVFLKDGFLSFLCNIPSKI